MSTAIRGSLTDHSPKDGSGDEINGSEVDENSYVLADILDGSTATDLGGAGAVDFLALRSIVLDNAAASIKVPYTLEWDPADGLQMTDNLSGIGVEFKMPDDGDTQTVFARLAVICVTDGAASLEEGEYSFRLAKAGTVTEIMTLAPTTGLTLGVDDTGYDLKAFGATSGKSWLWDESADKMIVTGDASVSGITTLTGIVTHGAAVVSDTDSTDDIGTTIVRWANVYTDAIGDTGQALTLKATTLTGGATLTVTTSSGAMTLNPATDVILPDDKDLALGTGADSLLSYNGTNTVWNLRAVGTGNLLLNNGIVIIGDGTTTAKTGATIAFGVDGRANDNIHRWIENADVATGRTSPGSGKLFNWTTTTTDILVEGKASATLGGYRMTALGEDNASLETVMQFDSHGGTAPTAKTQAGGYGLIDFYAAEHDGANNIANITADGNVFSVSARVGSADITVFMVDEDGQGHLVNTTLVALSDDKDDAQMLRALDLSLVKAGKATGYVKSKYDDQIVYSEEDLVKYRILGDTIANGGLWCWSREVHLHRGAIWQNYTAIQDHAEILEAQAKRLALMEKQVKLLGKAA